MRRKIWVPAVTALVVALIAATAMLISANISKSGGGGGGGCKQSGTGNTQICRLELPRVDPSADSAQASKDIYRDVSPTGRGPWPFAVLHDNIGAENVGLFVLSAPTRAGHHIGLAQHASLLWVDCSVITDFDADPSTGNGGRWLRVRWSRGGSPTNAVGTSSPSDVNRGYVYAAYTAPDGSNGQVPRCGT